MIWLDQYNITDSKIHYNTDPKDLYKITISKGQGILTSDGTLSVNTGKFTGRSPRDRYIVKDEKTKNKVWWGDINRPFNEVQFSKIEDKLSKYLSGKNLYVRDCSACASQKSEIKIRTICELPWSDLFIHNMFLRNSLEGKEVDWTIICAPNFIADSEELGTDNSNFSIINFSKKKILIGGTAYTGEIKKGIFSVLNFLLPVNENTLPMHCSANTSDKGETSIFFGLSGTGKTTLSTDKNRKLIGDDEHGWDNNNTIFNFEGGCYAKVLDLSKDKEPDIFNAIRPCALLENIVLDKDGVVDYNNSSITQNSRVSYPIHHIENSVNPSLGSNPKNIFFLTADAFGVLPPISKLSPAQAAYHFISGYTSKLAGTEVGINDPVPNFSACFGAPFMPLHPGVYAKMLIDKINNCDVKVWLVNTGWIGGPFGVGKRIALKYTRSIINAVNTGELHKINHGKYREHSIFKFKIPVVCPEVPSNILSQKEMWGDDKKLYSSLVVLANHFNKNFEKYINDISDDTLSGGPIFSDYLIK